MKELILKNSSIYESLHQMMTDNKFIGVMFSNKNNKYILTAIWGDSTHYYGYNPNNNRLLPVIPGYGHKFYGFKTKKELDNWIND